ncbi:MAG: ABC transporter ATP-binding protein [Deltaproteobacteria bacterium]|nr:ABC transporter ATP-binding protein [Deltaproteobacteria bacterium]
MLEIRNLHVYYRVEGRELAAVSECNFRVEQSERFGIIGESGSGKTSLAHAIMGIGPGRVTGTILLQGENITALNAKDRRCLRGVRMAMSFPNSVESFHPIHRVCDQVAEVLTEHGQANKHEAVDSAIETLLQLGLGIEKHNALPHQLSGGERQRVLLAMALVGNPEVVILDEPTMGLDPLEGRDILKILDRCLGGRTALVISHDIDVVNHLCSRIGVLYAGRFMEIGPARQVLTNPRHPYTRALVYTIPGQATLRDLIEIRGEAPTLADRPGGCPFHPRCTQAISVCVREVPVLSSIQDRQVACHRRGIVEVLVARGIAYTYSGNGREPIHAVQEADVILRAGDFQVLVGETGSGKTTLAAMISGLLPIQRGQITINGSKTEIDIDMLRPKVQMIFQDTRSSVSHRFTVEQIVREPLDIQKIGNHNERNERIKKALQDVGLPPSPSLLASYSHQLSEGEVQRVVIARAIVQNPDILVADEPVSMLDPSLSARIMKLLIRIQQIRGLTVLMVTHNIALACHVASHLMVMLGGRVIEAGIARDVLAKPWHPYTRSLLGYEQNHMDKQREPLDGFCGFLRRCPGAMDICFKEFPVRYGTEQHWVCCHNYLDNKHRAAHITKPSVNAALPSPMAQWVIPSMGSPISSLTVRMRPVLTMSLSDMRIPPSGSGPTNA